MTRTPTKRLTTSIDHRSAKRRKQYSTRDPPWSEQKTLGKIFREVGKGAWPVVRILQEKGFGDEKWYLIEWYKHPKTGEEYRPQWRRAKDVAKDLQDDWEAAQEGIPQQSSRFGVRPNPIASDKVRSQRIIPDSSAKLFQEGDHLSDEALSPPTLIASRESSVSGPEISETQEGGFDQRLSINLPPLPEDEKDYQSLRSDRLATQSTLHHLSGADHTDLQSDHLSPSILTQPSSSTLKDLGQDQTSAIPLVAVSASEPSRDSPSRTVTRRNNNSSNPEKLVEASQRIQREKRKSVRSRKLPSILTQFSSVTGNSYYATAPQSATDSSSSSSRASRSLASPFRFVKSSQSTGTEPISPASIQSTSTRVVMATNGSKQSTGVASATPEASRTSPRISTRSSSRHRAVEERDMEPSALAITTSAADAEEPTDGDTAMSDNIVEESHLSNTEYAEHAESTAGDGDFPDTSNSADEPSVFDAAMASNMIHESIEEEPSSSAATTLSMNSKANSSQESLNNERTIPSVDGTMIPTHPLLGHDEYAIALPAEGKIKSVYDEQIKVQRKALVRFISRRGSPGTSEISTRKSTERLAMQELLQRLNDTCTHIDLGLPPLKGDYTLNSQSDAHYAEYAGSKFAMLGQLIDKLKFEDCSFVIMAQSGTLQGLIADYCRMKHITLRKSDRSMRQTDPTTNALRVDLLETQPDTVIELQEKPLFIVAFDVSFTTSDPQVQSIREKFGETLPIIHFLVANSSEHVERCVPESLTSNLRLRVVVRTTWLAASYLGGSVTYVPNSSDEPLHGRPMDMADLQRAVRKSPGRKMALMADIMAAAALSDDFGTNWTLGSMPELQLDDYVESPPKISRAASATPQPNTFGTKAVSRATTPMAKKRFLDTEPDSFTKRQRLTPVSDSNTTKQDHSAEVMQLRQQLVSLRSELAAEQQARRIAEQTIETTQAKANEWRNAHAELQRRYEKRRDKTKDLEKNLKNVTSTVENAKARQEKAETENKSLRDQMVQLRSDLSTARNDLKASGGDIASLEVAREEARAAISKTATLEKSLENTKKDFEFTRTQYQNASSRAAEMASQISDLESQLKKLEVAASDRKRSLKALNYDHSIRRHIESAERVKLEVRNRDAVIKKLQEENTNLKSKRGVQTRGSSVQPGGSPGPRSRQASPAPGYLAPPTHTRASILRHER